MKTIDAEVIAPNNPENPWPHPVGFPVVLGNNKAYFIACASGAGRGADLLEKLDDAQKLAERYETPERNDDGVVINPVRPSEMIRKLTEFALFNLALQYNDDTVNEIINSGALTAKDLNLIVAVTAGGNPGYEVTNKKK